MKLLPFDTLMFTHRAIEQRTVRLGYELKGRNERLALEEQLTLPFDPDFDRLDSADLEAALTGLHLIAGISYWKTCCPPQIFLENTVLSPWEASFWNEVYTQGLGEFFFRNRLDPNDQVHFPADDSIVPASHGQEASGPALVLVGGGKDSIVSHEILRQATQPHTLFYVGNSRHIDPLIATLDAPRLIFRRRLDPKLFDLNATGAFNGHVPVSAYYAFAAQLVAVLSGFGAIIASNERSASQGNLGIGELEVNHQWSKGSRFEILFQEWQRRYLHCWPAYFSLLRPLSELRIGREFAKYPAHFQHFSSCNQNFRQGTRSLPQRWCGRCSKCLFVFILLAPWIEDSILESIFGGNLLLHAENRRIVMELLGLVGHKPFDCVGSPDEVAAALWLCHTQGRFRETETGRIFMDQVLPGMQHLNDWQSVY